MTSTDQPLRDGASAAGAHGHGGMDNPDVAHEHSDVNIRAILSFAVGLVVTGVVCAGIVWMLFRVLDRRAAANDPAVSPLALPAGQPPPEPALLTNEPGALKKFREEQARALDTYGWVNQQSGVARVPIAEAKKLIAERGLPVRSGVTVPPQAGTHAPATGESSGGRTIKP